MKTAINFTFMDSKGLISRALMLLEDHDMRLFIDGEEKTIVGRLDIATFGDDSISSEDLSEDLVSDREFEKPSRIGDSREDQEGTA